MQWIELFVLIGEAWVTIWVLVTRAAAWYRGFRSA